MSDYVEAGDKREGGALWEMSVTRNALVEAIRNGDETAIQLTAIRHSEALVNLAYTRLVPSLENVLQTVVRTEVGDVARALDGLKVEVQNSASVVAARLGKLEAGQNTLRRGQASVRKRLDRKRKELDTLQERVAALEAVRGRLDALEHFREGVEYVLAERPEQRRREYRELLEKIESLLSASPTRPE